MNIIKYDDYLILQYDLAPIVVCSRFEMFSNLKKVSVQEFDPFYVSAKYT